MVRAATNCITTPSGIVDWWPADGSANGIISGNNGALEGNAIASAPGVVGTSFFFDGTNGYVQISDAPELDPTNLTISAWVNFRSLDSQGSGGSPAGDQYLVFKQNTRNSSFEGYDLSKTRLSGGDRFRFLIASASGQSLEIDGSTLLTTGVWYHVAAVRGSNFTQIYVNGQLDAQGSVSFAQNYGTLPLYFGTSGQTFWDHKLNGYLDEVALYNRALSSTEIAAEYAAGSAGRCKGAAIISQSSSQSATVGSNVLFSVNASGYGSLAYQWRFNNANISGATTSALALNNVQTTNAGSYTVIAGNSLGSVTSSVIVLTILVPPTITSQPTNQSVPSGSNAVFTVTATGSAPLAYQWRSNGANLAGATGSALTLVNVQPANGGSYSVVVSNSIGSVTSATAVLTVLVAPTITSQPQSTTNLAGTTANFSATASGSAPLNYQWQINGANLSNGGRVSGATSPNLSISGVQLSDSATYTLVVSNTAGVVTSSNATLTVLASPTITTPPANVGAAVGSNATFTVTAAGSGPLSYQWQFNATNLAGATGTALTLTNITVASGGSYAVVVTNIYGATTSTPGVLTVLIAPTITTQPQSRTNIPGTTATFTGAASGSTPIGYQWRLNGTPLTDGGRISGSATGTLTISSVQVSDAGSYTLVATNSVGSATSQAATLTVPAPPTITTQPAGATVMSGTTVGFSVSATGAQPLGYQWRFNGANISGATATGWTVTNAQPTNAGGYSVVVSNLAGSVTSTVATLTVIVPTDCFAAPPGLVGWWTGDGNANDIVGGNNGILESGATASGVGEVGGAFTFDGVSSYVQIADNAALRPTNLTVEAWVQFAALDSPGSGTAPAGDQYIVFKQNSQQGNFEGYDLSKTRVNGSDVFRFMVSSSSGESALVLSSTLVTTGVWYHVAGVRGPNTTQIYVNGQLEAQTNVDFAQDYGTLPLFFGTSGESYWDQKLDGMLDEVSLYNRALSGTEIAAIYNAGSAGKCKAPAITSQPQSQSAAPGANVSFSVTATGLTPLSYRWQFNGTNISGATNATLSLIAVQLANAGSYTVTVSNSAGSVSSAAAVLNVFAVPAISGQPASLTNIVGSAATFSVTATGTPSPSYQWTFDGANIAGATGTSLTLNSAQTTDAGSYAVVVTNSAGAITSSVATLTVWVPPGITSQPQSLTNLVGTSASFSVTATGTQPLGYQWQFNGANIAGATGSSFTLNAAQATDAGSYAVAVTNVAGAMTSGVATLTIWVPPGFSSQPTSRTNIAGTDASFSVMATGTQPLSYQWQFNGANISGATATSYTATSVQAANAGSYAVVVTNVAGAMTSTPAVLTVWTPPSVTSPPLSATNIAGTMATFSVMATGTQPLGYQWQFNGTTIAGATQTSLIINNVQTTNGGSYAVVITNMAGAMTSATAVLTVWTPPAITSQPQSLTNIAGTDASFSVAATGTSPFGYQWQFNGANISGATASSYTASSVQAANAGSYAVVVTNVAGAMTSAPAVLTVWTPPSVTSPPQSATNIAGTAAMFSVTASGTQPLGYQWQFNGANLAGATLTSLNLNNVQATNGGSYAVVITNIAGAMTSATAVLTVWTPPTITSQPQSLTNIAGTDASFSVGASGTSPFGYQWLFNGANISGATSASYTATSVQATNAGNYAVVVTNVAGAMTSTPAMLTVWTPPSITSPPESVTNFAGTDATFNVTASGTQPLGYQWQWNGTNLDGQTQTSLTVSNVQSANAGSYAVVVTNIVGITTSTVATLTVWTPPKITSQPQSLTNLSGTDASFSVGVTGTYPLSYQWSFNGTNLLSATNSTLTLPAVQTNNAGSYSVIVTNFDGAATSTVATLTVWVLPSVTTSPQSQTNLVGATPNFTVGATGTQPLSYQWQFNGANIAGATGTSLSVGPLQTTNAGGYSVVVTNIAGATTSGVAALTVWVPPGISANPQSQTNLSGSTASFSVSAGGTQPLSYQWLMNGLPLSGATASNLTLNSVQTNNAGSYSVVVTNVAGLATSTVATLTVWVVPTFTTQPVSLTNLVGTAASFSAAAYGTAPLSYQWQFNGTNIGGANGTSLSFGSVQTNNAGSYALVITNVAGASTSMVATLTVWVPPTISSQPQSTTNLTGANVNLSVTAGGTSPLSYQWLFNNAIVAGASSSSLTLSNAQLSSAGSYSVIITNVGGAITSTVATVTMWVLPTITNAPLSRTNLAGTDALFTAGAAGTQPLSYQWLFNGTNLSGATSSALTVSAVQTNNAGSYAVLVTNVAGSITSVPAILTVWVPPGISTPPQSQTNLVNSTANFTVAATGTQPLSYQWQFNGTNLSGATGTSLTLNPVQLTQAGAYAVVITNVAGSMTSAPATLTVWVPPAIITQPLSVTNTAGSSTGFSVSATGTQPISYQWRFDGAPISGATTANLSLTNVQVGQAGSYDVVVTNVAGSTNSVVAILSVNVLAPFHPGAGAVVLVNSHSARYLDFQHFVQPYLDNFGFPYVVQDISTNAPGQSLTNYAVIIIGHSQIDTNLTYLTSTAQNAIASAVTNGVGLVNFDNNLASGTSNRYQFVQSIFGFTYGSSASASSATIPPTDPSFQMQYITALHPTNDTVTFRSSITMPGISTPATVTNVALCGGKPLVSIRKYGLGHAVQWGSYDWMVSTVLGPLDGLDDLIWRGIVWAGRKPLVMRGMPNIVSMRVDDISGPLWWVHVANQVGFKPFLPVFLNDMTPTVVADIRGLTTSSNATCSIHSISSSTMFYFNHQTESEYSDTVQSNNFYSGTQWHLTNGIPISKVCATHYSEIGTNAFGGLKNWGMEFVPIEVVPGTVEYAAPYAPWVVAGPYRLYETPQQGQVNWPTYYADWLTVPGHPEFSNQFFNAYCEVRDYSSCGEWCPDNDVAGTIARGTAIVKRDLDSMAMATLFTHEWYIHPTPCCSEGVTITTNNFLAELQGITNNLGAYNIQFVTLDYASQYMRATRTAKLISADYDPGSGHVTANFTGYADLALTVYWFTGTDSAIVANTTTISPFTNSFAAIVGSLPPQLVAPGITQDPTNQTVVSGNSATFSATESGTAPFSYQWLFNGSNLAGATASGLTLANAQTTNAGSYQLIVTNAAGAATSGVAVLTVLVPPSIALTPTNQTVVAGSTFVLNATVSGTEPMIYAWQLNSTNLPGAQDETLILTNLQPSQSGAYSLFATNAAGSATSAVVNLSVVIPPTITSQSTNTLALLGTSVQFSVGAGGSQPLTYQWLFNGTNLNGASGLTLTLNNIQMTQAGAYSVVVSNTGGVTNSVPIMLTVATRPILFAAPPTNNGLFTLTLQGDAGFNYLIECSTNYVDWNALSILSNVTGQADFTDPGSSNSGWRFYRARLSY